MALRYLARRFRIPDLQRARGKPYVAVGGLSTSHLPFLPARRLRPDLPLVPCGKCKKKIVREYRVRKAGPNNGRIFYMCPDHNWDGTGSCKGWYWEDQYVMRVEQYLADQEAMVADESAGVDDDEVVSQQKKQATTAAYEGASVDN